MIKVVGVRFRGSGKLYWFDPGDLQIRPDAHVIVETARGMEYGVVAGTVRELPEEKVSQPLRRVVRVAGEEDEALAAENKKREREAFAICKEKIRKHGLEMKLIDAEYTFDNTKILFYFTADGRVDFRDLVKDLAGVFRTRIELRQIGVRDETKILGGIGICGRPFCCHTWLTDFVPVSIKMAKEQSLSLNPAKISGVCGRLMCCLKNEEDTYEYLNARLPAVGDTVRTPSGMEGVVSQVSVLHQKVKVVIVEDDEKEVCEYDVEELTFHPKKNRSKKDGRKEADKKEQGHKEQDWKEAGKKEPGRKEQGRKEKKPETEDGKALETGGRTDPEHHSEKNAQKHSEKRSGNKKNRRKKNTKNTRQEENHDAPQG